MSSPREGVRELFLLKIICRQQIIFEEMSVNEVNQVEDDDVAQGRSEGRGTTDHKEVVQQSSEASSSKSAPRKRFYLSGSKFLLTFAQCQTPKEEVVERIRDQHPDAIAYIVARELHADGQPHLHVYLAFEEPRKIKDYAYFNTLVHPHKQANLKSVRSPKGAQEYCKKGGDYLTHGVDALGKKRKPPSTTETYIRSVVDGEISRDEGLAQYLGVRARCGSAIDRELDIQLRAKAKRQRAASSHEAVNVIPSHLSVPNGRVARWLNENIRKPRAPRQAQLWIKAGPGAGKTTFVDQVLPYLYPGLSIYSLPYDGEWQDDYEDGCYDLIIADEYRTQYRIQYLNRLADGSVTKLRRRAMKPVEKRDRLPMIVLSNYLPEEAYHKAADKGDPSIKALADRFRVVDYDTSETIRVTKDGEIIQLALPDPRVSKAGVTRTRTVPRRERGPVRYENWNGVEDPERFYRHTQPDSPLTLSPYSP